jgi:hypothetical protein
VDHDVQALLAIGIAAALCLVAWVWAQHRLNPAFLTHRLPIFSNGYWGRRQYISAPPAGAGRPLSPHGSLGRHAARSPAVSVRLGSASARHRRVSMRALLIEHRVFQCSYARSSARHLSENSRRMSEVWSTGGLFSRSNFGP